MIRNCPFFLSTTASTKVLNLVRVETCFSVFLRAAASVQRLVALPKKLAPSPSWECTKILYLLALPAVEASLQSKETYQISSPVLPLALLLFLVFLS